MLYFLVIFNRALGKIITRREFTDPAEALEARFAAEDEHQDDPDIEVVVLGGDSLASLMRTHARYFRDLGDLRIAL